MNQFPPSPRVSNLGFFKFFWKFTGIFAAQGAPPRCRWHRWQTFFYLWVVELTFRSFFYFKFTFRWKQSDIVHKFTADVVDTVVPLELKISPGIFRKIRNGGRWFMKKTWSKKSLDTVPLKSTWTFFLHLGYLLLAVRTDAIWWGTICECRSGEYKKPRPLYRMTQHRNRK